MITIIQAKRMGISSEMIPVNGGKPIIGYRARRGGLGASGGGGDHNASWRRRHARRKSGWYGPGLHVGKHQPKPFW